MFPLLALALAAGASGADRPQLEIRADAPEVGIGPRPAGREFLSLPDLEYRFAIEALCPADWQVAAVSVSVADTRRALELADGTLPVSAELKVPAQQLAPLPVSGFCVADDTAAPPPGAGAEELRIDAALSAHASLLCVAGEQQRLAYASRPLGVTLVCERSVEAPGTQPD